MNTSNINYIHRLRERYYKSLPGKESLVQLINETEVSEHVYNSNAIENSTLTLEETEKILLQIDLDRFVTERELFEAKNLAKVTEYIHQKAEGSSLDKGMMLLLHKMLMLNIYPEVAGRFRKGNEYVKVGHHIAPAPFDIDPLIQDLFTEYAAYFHKDIVSRIAKFHVMFENIHPFVDGNGRIGRVLINYLLIREGFVPINIAFVDRKHYYEAIREYDVTGKTIQMENLVYRALTNSYHKRLAYLEGKTIMLLSDFARQESQSQSNVINKAYRQTIPAFYEKGKWKISV